MNPFTMMILVGVMAVIITRRFQPLLAGAIGLALTVAIAVWGLKTYAGGGGLAFGTMPVSREFFLVAVAFWAGMEIWSLRRILRARKEAKAEAQAEAQAQAAAPSEPSSDA
jgi:hypothetical protein